MVVTYGGRMHDEAQAKDSEKLRIVAFLIDTLLSNHFSSCRFSQICVCLSPAHLALILTRFPHIPIIHNPSRQFVKSHVVLFVNEKYYFLFKTQQGGMCWAHYEIMCEIRENPAAVPVHYDASRREPRLGRLFLIGTSCTKHFSYCRRLETRRNTPDLVSSYPSKELSPSMPSL